ncbi:MAG TPA: tetratricopeptide repeat protein [Terriglobales bacterium]|nr:tetratricopeptide repeat protein [Terriglobales bacterium]
MRQVIAGWVFLFVGLNAVCGAQDKLPGLAEILERHVEALGGRANINAVETVVQHLEYREGSFVIPDAFIARMRPYYKTIGDPKNIHVDVNEGYDGSAWEYYGDPGVVIRTVGAAAAAARHGTEIIDSLVEPEAAGTRIQVVGEEPFAGKPAYHLHVVLADGFEKEMFVDPRTYLIVGDRRSAPVHAFGSEVRSENRIGDYRRVNGVLFPFKIVETEIATGKELNSNTVKTLEVNSKLDASFFGPPQFERTPLQQMLEQLYMERTDPVCVMWTYRGFRAAHPKVDTREGVEFIGYQMAKMRDFNGAVELLTANAADYPQSASAQFGLGRAYRAAGDIENARLHFKKALEIDPKFKKASEGLDALR